MRKSLLLVMLSLISVPVWAANTTLQGSIIDGDSQSWNNGTVSAILIPTSGTGGALAAAVTGTVDGSGNYSISLPPSGTGQTYQVTVTGTASGALFITNIAVGSSSPQTNNLTPPAIRINMAVPSLNYTAYADAEVTNASPGQTYFNTTSTAVRVCVASPCTGASWVNGSPSSSGASTSNSVVIKDPSFGSSLTFTTNPCETSYGATTLSTGGATTVTGQSCLPANSIIDAVVGRVTTTITGSCTGWEFGDGTTAARFTSNNTNLTAGSTSVAYSGTAWSTGIASATTGMRQGTAGTITVTCAGGAASAGAIRIVVYSHTTAGPTS